MNNDTIQWFEHVPRIGSPSYSVQMSFGAGKRNRWLRGIGSLEEAEEIVSNFRKKGGKARIWREYVTLEVMEL